MLHDVTTGFVRRLRAREPAAWFELWESFGPIVRAQLARWGRGRIGVETVQDLSQETLAALSGAIDRHDPSRGARFSTWLLAIARHTLGDEMDRRMALKRGSGVRPAPLEAAEGGAGGPGPDAAYEDAIFEAKVAAALRAVERECGFAEFEVYRLRVLEGRSGQDVARSLGTSESSVSRRLTKTRLLVRTKLQEVFAKYSFTPEEWEELSRKGLDPIPTKEAEASFDEAVAETYQRFTLRSGAGRSPGPPASAPGAARRRVER